MKKHKQPKGLEPGIYFTLAEDAYHADPALSHSGMVKLLIHPLEYWHSSSLNPEREFKESPAMTFGKRCHKLLLEEAKFFEEFAVQGGREFNVKKTFMPRSEFQNIKDSIGMIKAVPDAFAYFERGYPEVSLVVDDPETGIRLRIRVDYLRSFGGIDYKRARDVQNNPLGWHIADFGYDIQDALYRKVIGEAKRLLRAGKIKAFGNVNPAWLDEFAKDDAVLFCFFFQRSTRPYIFRIMNFDDEIRSMAESRVRQAIDIYKFNIERYGVEEWPAGSPEPEEFSIHFLPRRIFDQGGTP